jgi:hypothetical protein
VHSTASRSEPHCHGSVSQPVSGCSWLLVVTIIGSGSAADGAALLSWWHAMLPASLASQRPSGCVHIGNCIRGTSGTLNTLACTVANVQGWQRKLLTCCMHCTFTPHGCAMYCMGCTSARDSFDGISKAGSAVVWQYTSYWPALLTSQHIVPQSWTRSAPRLQSSC